MDSKGYRQNGGIGFSISEPRACVHVSTASAFSFQDKRKHPLHPEEQRRLARIAKKFAELPVRIEIVGDMPSHYGLGSATAIRLATLEGIAIVSGRVINRSALVRTSGRGGTSGIGVTTYFDGGLVFDVGVRNKRMPLLPSSAIEGVRSSPLILTACPMPSWKIGLCIPSNIQPKSEKQEVAFFKRACPLPNASTSEVLYHVIYGVVASIREEDFEAFCAAIKSIQQCTWKRLERELYGDPLLLLEKRIYEAGARAVGMSSLGPGLFFLADNLETVTRKLRKVHPQHVWTSGTFHNSGRYLV